MNLAKDRWKLSLSAIAVLAFALRIWHLGARSLWMDEGDSVGFARMQWPALLHLLNIRELNMVLYYLFLRIWLHLGDSEIFLRIPSVLFGTAAVVATCIFAQRTHSRTVAILAGLFVSFNVLAIRYTQEVRGYALMMMLVAFSWVAYERAVRRGSFRDIFWWIAISVLAVYAHFFSGLIFLAQVACLAFVDLDGYRQRTFLRAIAAYFALLVPALVIVLRMTEDPLSWVHPLSREVFRTFARDFLNGGVIQVGIAAVLMTASIVILVRAPRERRWALGTAIVGTLLPITVTVLVSLVKPALIPRYLLVALPTYAVAIAVPLTKVPRSVMVGGAAIVILLGFPLLLEYEREPASNDFRDAVAYIAHRSQPGDALMIWEPLARPAVEYYAGRQKTGVTFPEILFPGGQRPLIAEDVIARPDPKEIDRICDKYKRIWILYSVDFTPERYYVWHVFFVRRASIHHRLVSKIVIPGIPGVQVLEFERAEW